MTPAEFEAILEEATLQLTKTAQEVEQLASDSKEFERVVLDKLREVVMATSAQAQPTFHQHAFPDIAVNGFGVEVKFTKKNSWQAVGNSVFEGMRDPTVERVYVIFGKMGGWPEVRWARYEECITHVRISHAPRFVIQMEDANPLFSIIGIEYSEFARLSAEEKMEHVREYSRSRLKTGERLWWLEDQGVDEHTWPAEVRLYMHLDSEEKDQLRAEAALLCPEIVAPPQTKFKYADAALYLLRQHGVFCPQARDLFSAGSVALRDDPERGGNYLLRALEGIQDEMRTAARELDDELFVEYWGESCPPERRVVEWLKRADQIARDWLPSEYLFLSDQNA